MPPTRNRHAASSSLFLRVAERKPGGLAGVTATVLLVRHAVTDDLDVRLSGRRPGVPLSAAGRAQAAALGERLRGAGIAQIACSPLERTMQTAQAIAEACGLAPPVPANALIELDLGRWTGATFASLDGDPYWTRWNEQRATARVPGGESMAEATARITGWLHATAAAAREGEVIAAVTHSDMIRGAVADVLGLSLDRLHRFDVEPASVTRVVVGDWGAKLVGLNG